MHAEVGFPNYGISYRRPDQYSEHQLEGSHKSPQIRITIAVGKMTSNYLTSDVFIASDASVLIYVVYCEGFIPRNQWYDYPHSKPQKSLLNMVQTHYPWIWEQWACVLFSDQS
ncbi:hypothetical protein TNCV_3982571 [Trichonephila clavipes]|nr:hypothetical protein TNCV_3982571 [Trichonephila clavipes]